MSWSFDVDRNAALSAAPADTTAPGHPHRPRHRAPPGSTRSRRSGTSTAASASAPSASRAVRSPASTSPTIPSIVADERQLRQHRRPASAGYLSTYNCTSQQPEVSTLGYTPGNAVANQAFVPLAGGDVCVFSLTDTDVVIDVNGYYRSDSGAGFTPVTPVRLFDSRDDGRAPRRRRGASVRRGRHRPRCTGRRHRGRDQPHGDPARRGPATCGCTRAAHPARPRSRRSTSAPATSGPTRS